MGNKLIIAIDFDGTIVESQYPKLGALRKGAFEIINQLKEEGHTIIIWTCRYLSEDLFMMKRFLDTVGIKYDAINKNSPTLKDFHPSPKIYADVYVDDRQVGGLPDWYTIYYEIRKYALQKSITHTTGK